MRESVQKITMGGGGVQNTMYLPPPPPQMIFNGLSVVQLKINSDFSWICHRVYSINKLHTACFLYVVNVKQ